MGIKQSVFFAPIAFYIDKRKYLYIIVRMKIIKEGI